jgi:hypothetical protein
VRVLDRLHGHEPILEGLWRAAAAGRLPHALSFEGPGGVGKFNAALRFANGLLCAAGPGPPCGDCAPCKRVRSGARRGNHPDLYLVDAVEEARERQSGGKRVLTLGIKLGRIAIRGGEDDCAEGFLRLVSAEDGWRIVVIREAERMQTEAQNALLKTLEEPGSQTLLVLETARPGDLLPTIRSRLVRIRFDRLTREETEGVLRDEGIGEAPAGVLAAWSEGAPGEALRLEREGALGLREHLLSVITGERRAHEAAAELWKLPGETIGSTPRARDRHRARVALDVVLDLAGDAMRVSEGVPAEGLRHGDLVREGTLTADSLPGARLLIERCLDLRAAMAGNVSPEATLERCLLALERARGVPSLERSH